jgi:hypothetical protein
VRRNFYENKYLDTVKDSLDHKTNAGTENISWVSGYQTQVFSLATQIPNLKPNIYNLK